MLSVSRLAIVCALAALSAFAQTDWTTATELPEVDLKGLTAAQTKQALDLLRAEPCTCGCGMKLAECRIGDPQCRDSKALSYIVTEGIRNRRTATQIHDDLVKSPIAKIRADQNRILLDPVDVRIAGAPSRGPENARITLVEFSDFECPYCSVAVRQIEEVLKAYPHDIRLVYKQYPLEMHAHAVMAAEASLAANAQGRFWEMYEKLFANSRHLSREKIVELAKELNLDMVRFTRDMDAHTFRKQVEQDITDGERIGVAGTPTLYINRKQYRGPLELGVLTPILKDELKGKPASAHPESASR